MTPCERRDDAGVWVLGALDDAEAAGYARHLETCAACRREVAALQGVVDVLPVGVPLAPAPPALKARIMTVVESEAELLRASGPQADRVAQTEEGGRARRRPGAGWASRLRPLPLLALGCVLLALGVGVGALVAGGNGTDSTTHRGFGPGGAQVALHVTGDRGELVLDRMPPAPAGKVYEVWLVHDKQVRPTNALFQPRNGRATVAIDGGLDGADQVLVSAEPPGGSDAPTSTPVAGAQLS